MARIDQLLDELAQHSEYSSITRFTTSGASRRQRKEILDDLFHSLTPFGAACITQIILKDLRPILYPCPATRFGPALQHYNAKSLHELTIFEAMNIWHPQMPRIYRLRATLDAAAEAVEQLVLNGSKSRVLGPIVGIPVEIPKCLKGDGCEKAINLYCSGSQQPTSIFAETKYDGERYVTAVELVPEHCLKCSHYRMQIHVDLDAPLNEQIRIISKSKRDSTLDRSGTHPLVKRC